MGYLWHSLGLDMLTGQITSETGRGTLADRAAGLWKPLLVPVETVPVGFTGVRLSDVEVPDDGAVGGHVLLFADLEIGVEGVVQPELFVSYGKTDDKEGLNLSK